MATKDTNFHSLPSLNKSIELPQKFTYPFYYEPHELCVIAARELQAYLEHASLDHNFGLSKEKNGMVIGKMFGVLLVKNNENELGYLQAYSGKLANSNHHEGFVPPVFDLLDTQSFFLKEEEEINAINREIEQKENEPKLLNVKSAYAELHIQWNEKIAALKLAIKENKKQRDEKRAKLAAENAFDLLLEQLKQESIAEQYQLKKMNKQARLECAVLSDEITAFEHEIQRLKDLRKTKSSELQKRIHQHYTFLNAQKDSKSLLSIFEDTIFAIPPAGAGECCAPKLLHYAYLNEYQPLAMAEFWWGASPQSEIRLHKQFYPACKGKCEPILKHMLVGLTVEENPLLQIPTHLKPELLYEDDALLVLYKPAELLSVPGIEINESMFTYVLQHFSDVSGPVIVHRLDMSTSGVMIFAKNKESHKKLQQQFIKHKVEKRYVALLDGTLESNEGEIHLPLCLNIEDRPRQMVSFEHGKRAETYWKKISVENGKTRVHLFPKTGRTHQLRVHMAHPLGLNCPIVGDDLYGNKANRLHLHAEEISFFHPTSNEWVSFRREADF